MKKIILALLILSSYHSSNAQWNRLWYAPNDWLLNALHFTKNNVGFVGGLNGRIYRTTDGGSSWNSVHYIDYERFYSISFADTLNGLAVGGSGGWNSGIILRTTNGGLNWYQQHYGLNSEIFYDVHCLDSLHAVAVGSAGRIISTTDGGVNWVYQTSGLSGDLYAVYFINPDLGFIATDWGLLKTTNGGNNWIIVPGLPFLRDICFVNDSIGFAVGSGIYRTSDGGNNWILQYNFNHLGSVSFSDSSCGTALGWTGFKSIIFRTFNGGQNWINQEEIDRLLFKVHFPSRDTGYITGVNQFMLHTVNGGVPAELISFNAIAEGKKITLTWSTATELNNHGFEIERKNNDSWRTIGFLPGNGTTSEIHNYVFSDYLSDFNGGLPIWYRLKQVDYDGSFEYSEEIEVLFVPDYKLHQNYPNPFNPATIISYSIPVHCNVHLIIYDALGRKISQLVNEEKDAGNYKLEFNSDGLPSGVYFCELRAGTFSDIIKMTVMK